MLSMEEEECNTKLSLGIGGGSSISSRGHTLERMPPVQLHVLFPPRMKKKEKEEQKREKEQFVSRSRSNKAKEEVVETKEASCCSDDRGRATKKLRLTKEQSAMLEDSFSEQNTLYPIRKLQLAKMLDLRPRQVEVWFQNRRARTKLKKMETNWEVLKKRCENLADENQRLKGELQEVMLMKSWSPSGVHLSKVSAVFSLCPSCKQIDAGDGGMTIDTIDMVPNKPSIYNMASRILSSNAKQVS